VELLISRCPELRVIRVPDTILTHGAVFRAERDLPLLREFEYIETLGFDRNGKAGELLHVECQAAPQSAPDYAESEGRGEEDSSSSP
jgi:hypothetical protein